MIRTTEPTHSGGHPAASAFDGLEPAQGQVRDWGISRGPWLWATRIRILFVIDGPISLSRKKEDFGLHQVIQTLRDPEFAWWVRFEVDVGHRDGDSGTAVIRDHRYDPVLVWRRYTQFRFTQPGFDLDDYDQVWFFGFHPGQELDDSRIGNVPALENAELKRLAEWMDRGGGVFAAGDHGILGASLCSRVPRVRTMRKWKVAQGVPTRDGPTRYETLVHLTQPPGDEPTLDERFAFEGDRWPQRIEPVYHQTLTGPLALPNLATHPILCAPNGIIDRFPDHMHEGEVIEDGAVKLDEPLDIPGYTRPEYPVPIPEVALAGAPPGVDPLPLSRPRPRVIAHGWTTNFGEPAKRFALIGVYDGDDVKIGRVVVDSTWHHWFSYNLVGFQADNQFMFEKMQAYYRNVGLWLSTPAQRASMLASATWGALAGLSPMAFQRGMSAWEVGERVVDVIGRTASQCILTELVATFLQSSATDLSSAPSDRPSGEPCWSCLPEALINRAIVGGLGAAMLDLALDYADARARGLQPRLDPQAIRERASDGAAHGHRLLTAALGQAATDLAAVRDRLAQSFRAMPAEVIPIPVELARIRLIAERIQFPDAADPALLDDLLSLTVRVRLNGSIVAAWTLREVAAPRFEAHGGLLDLGHDLIAVDVQSGQALAVEVLVGEWTLDEVDPGAIRFSETLNGDPSGWLGRHLPERTQAWRLWYRIE